MKNKFGETCTPLRSTPSRYLSALWTVSTNSKNSRFIRSNLLIGNQQPFQIQCSQPLLYTRMILNAPPIAHKTAPNFLLFWRLISSNRMNSKRFLCLISTAFYTRYTVLESRGTNRSTRKSTLNIDRFTHKLEKRGGISAIVGTTRWGLKLIILLKIR